MCGRKLSRICLVKYKYLPIRIKQSFHLLETYSYCFLSCLKFGLSPRDSILFLFTGIMKRMLDRMSAGLMQQLPS